MSSIVQRFEILRGGNVIKMRSAVPFGLLDAGFASLAAFAAGLYAAREFDGGTLGLYALFFTAFVLAAVLPTQLILVPIEITTLQHERLKRLSVIGRSLRQAIPLTILSGLFVVSVALVSPAPRDSSFLIPLAATAGVATVLSPLQDHVRRLMHIAAVSWRASLMSVVQFLAAVGTITVAILMDAPAAWIPFGSLVVANLTSLTVGLLLARHDRANRINWNFKLRDLIAVGRFLLAGSIVAPAAAFGVSSLVISIAGSEVLGFAEAARVVSQPVFVLGVGMSGALGPRLMEAASVGAIADADRLRRLFRYTVTGAGAVYLLWVAFEGPWNPFSTLVPQAYAVSGLVSLSVVANIMNGLAFPARSELVGGGKASALPPVEVVGNLLRVSVAATAPVSGAFSIPAGTLALALGRMFGFERARESLYAGRSDTDTSVGRRVDASEHDVD